MEEWNNGEKIEDIFQNGFYLPSIPAFHNSIIPVAAKIDNAQSSEYDIKILNLWRCEYGLLDEPRSNPKS